VSDFDAELGFESPIPPPPRPIEYADVDPSGWWLSMLLGVALVLLGVWLLTNLFESVVVLAILVGVSLIVGGIAEATALGGRDGLGWPAWLAGGVVVALGIVVLVWPDITLLALAVLAGAAVFVAGALEMLAALLHRDDPGWPLLFALGGLGIVLGVLIMAWPDVTLVVLAVVLGLRAIVGGLVALGVGWQMWHVRRMAS